MNLEQRLQHAARELRAVDIAVPPLGTTAPRSGRARRLGVQVVAVPLLFIVGGLVVAGVLDDRREAAGVFDDTGAAVLDAAEPTSTPAVAGAGSSETAVPALDTPSAASAAVLAPSSLGHPTAVVERDVIDRIVATASVSVAPVSAQESPPRTFDDHVPI